MDYIIDPAYEEFTAGVLEIIEEMRLAGGYDEDTLEAIEWRMSPPKEETND